MQLTGKQIVAEGIITNIDLDNAVQQQGVDLRVIQVNRVVGKGRIPKKGKTYLPSYEKVALKEAEEDSEVFYWDLEPGYYEIIFAEGCKMPNNRAMTFVQRSSLLRSGVIIRSSQFDAGFETEHMGTFMQVFNPVEIEYGARVAQTLVMETAEVENIYNGQFQKDCQRT